MRDRVACVPPSSHRPPATHQTVPQLPPLSYRPSATAPYCPPSYRQFPAPQARDGLRGAHEELRDTAAQWPEWAKAIEDAMRTLQTGKADCGSVEDTCAALGERVEAVGR